MDHAANKATTVPALKSRRSTKERAITVAQRILLGEGYAKLTMERVALESGVAKTTLYRRWPTKASLCMDLYLDAARELHDPDLGDVASDLKRLAREVARLQTHTVAGPAMIGLIAEAQICPESRGALVAEFAERRRAVTRQVLLRGIKRGELRSKTDANLVIDAIGGAMTFRLLQGHAPVDRNFTDDLIDLVLDGCRKGQKG